MFTLLKRHFLPLVHIKALRRRGPPGPLKFRLFWLQCFSDSSTVDPVSGLTFAHFREFSNLGMVTKEKETLGLVSSSALPKTSLHITIRRSRMLEW